MTENGRFMTDLEPRIRAIVAELGDEQSTVATLITCGCPPAQAAIIGYLRSVAITHLATIYDEHVVVAYLQTMEQDIGPDFVYERHYPGVGPITPAALDTMKASLVEDVERYLDATPGRARVADPGTRTVTLMDPGHNYIVGSAYSGSITVRNVHLSGDGDKLLSNARDYIEEHDQPSLSNAHLSARPIGDDIVVVGNYGSHEFIAATFYYIY